MKSLVFFSCAILLCACATDTLENTKSELIGCWELTSVDGNSGVIHYINYNDSKAVAYWGGKGEQGLLMKSMHLGYQLKLDKEDRVILENYYKGDTTVCEVSIKNNSRLECTILKSKSKWVYKRISEKQLNKIIDSAIDLKEEL